MVLPVMWLIGDKNSTALCQKQDLMLRRYRTEQWHKKYKIKRKNMSKLKTRKVGIIMNGVTGRMGTNQHLMRSIVAIIKQGGVRISDSETIMPVPILIGRNEIKLKQLAELSGVNKYSTDLDSVLMDPFYEVYFDAQTTERRAEAVKKALEAGKNVYCEKPVASSSREVMELHKIASEKKLKTGVVQDKLWLPGFLKLKMLIDNGFFGKIHSVKGDFGYWVFEGDTTPPQRPSWNYRKEDGGGMILDMFPHWRYVIDNLFGEIKSVFCMGKTHVMERYDEKGLPYKCTADDAAYAIFEIEGGITAQFSSSWCTRVRKDDLLTMQVDGSNASAVVGLRKCFVQSKFFTPRPIWNPEEEQKIDFFRSWQEVPDNVTSDNAFKIQWELFLKYLILNTPFKWDLREGAKGVQLAEIAHQSWKEKRLIEIPEI
jgi:predicted dehydrogenase